MRYVIHAFKPREVDEWSVDDRHSVLGRYDVSLMMRTTASDATIDLFAGNIWYSDNETIAGEMAKNVARAKPGWDVTVCEVKSIATALVPEVVLKSVSNKGVLPT